MTYPDSLYASTADLRVQFHNQTLFEEAAVSLGVDGTGLGVASTPLSERGVAAAATGTVLLEALRNAVRDCSLLSTSADRCERTAVGSARDLFLMTRTTQGCFSCVLAVSSLLLFNQSAALRCFGNPYRGLDRIIAALQKTATTTVFGPISFDEHQQVVPVVLPISTLFPLCVRHCPSRWLDSVLCCVVQNDARPYFISQLTTNRFFDPATAINTLVLPVEHRQAELAYPATGKGLFSDTDVAAFVLCS
jgi:hypothetical protein